MSQLHSGYKDVNSIFSCGYIMQAYNHGSFCYRVPQYKLYFIEAILRDTEDKRITSQPRNWHAILSSVPASFTINDRTWSHRIHSADSSWQRPRWLPGCQALAVCFVIRSHIMGRLSSPSFSLWWSILLIIIRNCSSLQGSRNVTERKSRHIQNRCLLSFQPTD